MDTDVKTANAIRDTALAARAAGGKLARLPAAGRSALLRDLAAALGDAANRTAILAANAEDVARAKAEDRKSTRLNSSH